MGWHTACVRGGVSYGIQISAAGVMTALYRQDVWANNLANLDTAGFKHDIPSAMPRPAVRQEDGVAWLPSNAMLERLGGGALLNPNRISFSQGALRVTGNSLDVAVQGDGFLMVRDGSDPAQPLRLSRDGRLTRNNDAQLVQAASGMPVLDRNGQPITLDPRGEVSIDANGAIRQNGRIVAELRLADVPDRASLRKAGNGLFDAPREVFNQLLPARGTIRQGAVEDSSVDEVRALLAMTSAAREVDANVDMMRTHDRLMEVALARVGRMS